MLEEDVIDAPLEQDIPEQPEKPVSIRDNLASALEDVKSRQEEPKEPKVKKEKTETRVVEFKDKPKVKVSKDAPREAELPVEPEVKAPQSFQGANAPMWKALPRNVQEFMAKREDEFHRELTKQDEERTFGRSVKDLATPYLPLIKAEGGDIVKGFQSYLNTAYVLRTKTPQEKGQLLMQLAREFGADLRGATQQAQQPLNPVLHQLQQELQTLKGGIEQEKALKKQQEDVALKSQVEAFSADPKNVHFEAVKADMAALLRGGVAKDLQDAYDRAVYANPQTRSTLLQQQEDEKRLANDKKAKAEAAKRAGSSLKGGPGPSALRNGKITQPDLRKALESAFAEHRGEA